MPIPGFTDYKRREYCNSIKCHVQMLMNKLGENSSEYNDMREVCKIKCAHTAYEFHHWLIDNKFQIVKGD